MSNLRMLKKNGFWALMIVIVVACAIVATMLAQKMEEEFKLQVDLTDNQIYSIGQTTKNVLSAVDREIDIYTVYPQGEEDHTLSELLRRYQAENEKIRVMNLDPLRTPLAVQQFEEKDAKIEDKSIIVMEAGNETNYRVIKPEDLYEWQLEGEQLYATGMVAEQRVTSAINSIMGGKQSRVLFAEGHQELGEDTLYYIAGTLTSDDYAVETYHLIYNDSALTADDCLMFIAPMKDLSAEEADVLEKFLASGGQAVFLINPMAPELPNFQRVLGNYGLSLNADLIVEQEPERYFQNPVFIAPEIKEHPTTQMLTESGVGPVMSRCRSVKIEEKTGIEATALFVTSEKSFGKIDPLTQTLDREDGDKDGPFALAVAAENQSNGSRIVLFGSSDFISTLNNARYGGNLTTLMGGIVWANGQESTTVIIPPKSFVDPPLRITSQTQSMLLIILAVGVIPVVVLVTGALVWRKRVRQ